MLPLLSRSFPFQPFKVKAFFGQVDDDVLLEIDRIGSVLVLTDGETFRIKTTLDRSNSFILKNSTEAVDGIRIGSCPFRRKGNKVWTVHLENTAQ